MKTCEEQISMSPLYDCKSLYRALLEDGRQAVDVSRKERFLKGPSSDTRGVPVPPEALALLLVLPTIVFEMENRSVVTPWGTTYPCSPSSSSTTQNVSDGVTASPSLPPLSSIPILCSFLFAADGGTTRHVTFSQCNAATPLKGYALWLL
ncbi:hypothetical protein HZH68_014827 [Vespula germanica]|uniref:Uncharacterized protein n=1 Tax=Vespula germanica TaxID=30212 RepID=A0A834J9R7_VESGE|nr:hypothetical protein HZH68_014827 [Vespula germanica]